MELTGKEIKSTEGTKSTERRSLFGRPGLKPAAVSLQPFTETGWKPCQNYADLADVPLTLAVPDYKEPHPHPEQKLSSPNIASPVCLAFEFLQLPLDEFN